MDIDTINAVLDAASPCEVEKARLYVANQRGKLRLAEIKARETEIKAGEKDDATRQLAASLVRGAIADCIARLDAVEAAFNRD